MHGSAFFCAGVPAYARIRAGATAQKSNRAAIFFCGMGSPTKLAHAMFWWGEAKAGVAFMPPRGIRCDRLAARAARHCCTVPSEGPARKEGACRSYEKKSIFANKFEFSASFLEKSTKRFANVRIFL